MNLLSGLIVAHYLIVFAIAPLAELHVEHQKISRADLYSSQDIQKSDLLLFLHEFLFAQLSDKTDHIQSKTAVHISLFQSKMLASYPISHFSDAKLIQNSRTVLAKHDGFSSYEGIAITSGVASNSYSASNSGLSPPQV